MSQVNKVTYKTIEGLTYKEKQIAYRDLFSTPQGEVVLKDLLNICEWTTTGITNSEIANAYRSGRQDIIKYIDKMIESPLKDSDKQQQYIEE